MMMINAISYAGGAVYVSRGKNSSHTHNLSLFFNSFAMYYVYACNFMQHEHNFRYKASIEKGWGRMRYKYDNIQWKF